MADDETRVPDDLEEVQHEELQPDAYHASVPSSLTGFRGINQPTLIAGIGVGLALVIFTVISIIGRFHGAGAPSTTTVASRATAGPAANGLAGGPAADATPFIPDPTAFPTELETTAPFSFGSPRPAHTPYVPHASNTPVPYHPYGPGGARSDTNPSTSSVAGAGGGGRMSLEPPSTTGQNGNQDSEALDDLNDPYQRVVYRPVYDRAGTLVMVVPVPVVQGRRGRPVPAMESRYQYQTGGPSSSQLVAQQGYDQNGTGNAGATQNQPQPQPQTPPPSSEFVSSSDADGPSDAPGAASQQRFVKDQSQGEVGYTAPVSANQIDPTTIIAARLLTKIVSTLPGPVSAQVITPVYDSATHSVIVIPAGTKLFGAYDNAVIENQNRLLMAWQRLVFPDGHEFVIAGQPGVDAQGAAGFSGDTDYHRGALYTTAILLTVLAGAEAAVGGGSTQTCTSGGLITGQTPGQAVQCSTGTQISSIANKILDKNLSRQPTIIIRPPYEFRVFVTRDLPLDKYLVR
jgi:type IV secretory pathway VirB10-like protein